MAQASREVITFKVDKSLSDLMKGIANRSEFIRSAILMALDSLCPFCKGTGVLTPHKRQHWDQWSAHLPTQECRDCEEPVFVTSRKTPKTEKPKP